MVRSPSPTPATDSARPTLLGQSKAEEHVACSQRYVLPSVDRITDRRGSMIAAGLVVPELFPRLGVERDDVAVAGGSEQHAAGCREHAVRERALEQLEVPHGLSCFWIDRFDAGARRRIVRAARGRCSPPCRAPQILASLFRHLRCAGVLSTRL